VGMRTSLRQYLRNEPNAGRLRPGWSVYSEIRSHFGHTRSAAGVSCVIFLGDHGTKVARRSIRIGQATKEIRPGLGSSLLFGIVIISLFCTK
jgi:hypothetical protein